jgi:hypothetical protein
MRASIFFLIFIFCISCNLEEKEKIKVKTYFDVETFFKNEAKRMTDQNRSFQKTVVVNGKSEQKIVSIKNWLKEFEAFIAADINKASWRGAFKISSTANTKCYSSTSDKIPVKKLEVVKKDGKVVSIKIYVEQINALYTSQDSLSYFPDSLYRIKKSQQIKLMEKKKYEVIGRLVDRP